MSSPRTRFLRALLVCAFGLALGVTLFSGFHLVHDRTMPSLQSHELLGWIAGAAMAVHVALRWRWFAGAVRGLPRLRAPVRTNLLLGTFLTLAMGLQVASGALLEPGSAWQGLHHLTSKLVIAATVWHVVRHWPWIKARLAPWAARRGAENPVLEAGPSR
ncbi:MAG TPA: hypothetical protein VGK67_21705 [Myxococcales bacterium]|jgi:hypothetical protein